MAKAPCWTATDAEDSSCPAVLGLCCHEASQVSRTGLSPSPAGLPMPFRYLSGCSLRVRFAARTAAPPRPRTGIGCNLSHLRGLGSSAFARHYLRNHVCFLLLGVLRCFSSPGCPRQLPAAGTGPPGQWVPPFGHPRIHARVQLPVAFRRSPRPSSAPGAQASTVRPFHLHLTSPASPYPVPKVQKGSAPPRLPRPGKTRCRGALKTKHPQEPARSLERITHLTLPTNREV